MARITTMMAVLAVAAFFGMFTLLSVGSQVSIVAAQDDHGGDHDGGDGGGGDHSDEGHEGQPEVSAHSDEGHEGQADDPADPAVDLDPGIGAHGEPTGHDDPGVSSGGYFDDIGIDEYTFEYFGDTGFAMYQGVIFEPAKDMAAMRAAGLFSFATDPVAVGVGEPTNAAVGFFGADAEAFYDALRFKDNTAIQFIDANTGEHITPEVPDFSQGGYTSELRSEDALSAYEQAAGIAPGQFLELGEEFSFDLAQDLDFRGFSDLGEEAVFEMYEAMGDQFQSLDGGQIARMFNSLLDSQLHDIGGNEIFDSIGQMNGEDFQGMSSEQAYLLFETMALKQALSLKTEALAGLVSVFDPSQFEELGGNQVVQVVGALSQEDLAGLRNDQALGIATSLNAGQVGQVPPQQLYGLITALEADDIDKLEPAVVTIVAEKIEVDDLVTLDTDLAGAIFGQVRDGAIASFTDDRVRATLVALDADFFSAGAAGFDAIPGVTTIFDQVDFDPPDYLVDLVGGGVGQRLFGGNLFGNS